MFFLSSYFRGGGASGQVQGEGVGVGVKIVFDFDQQYVMTFHSEKL